MSLPDFHPDQNLQILDGNGNVVTYLKFNRILFTSLGDLSLSFNTNNPEFLTFSTTFIYNEMSIEQYFDTAY